MKARENEECSEGDERGISPREKESTQDGVRKGC